MLCLMHLNAVFCIYVKQCKFWDAKIMYNISGSHLTFWLTVIYQKLSVVKSIVYLFTQIYFFPIIWHDKLSMLLQANDCTQSLNLHHSPFIIIWCCVNTCMSRFVWYNQSSMEQPMHFNVFKSVFKNR